MILTEKDILYKLKNPDPRIAVSKNLYKKYRMHVHGIGTTEYITKMEGLENDVKIELRKRIARSNKDLLNELLRPVDKIFNARGGSRVYHIENENKEKEFREKLSTINGWVSIQKWLKSYWKDKYHIDPNGLFLIEHKEGIAYPTYKEILSVCDYHVTGRYVDYIIFEPCEKDGKKYIRVYDDEGDKMYLIEGESIVLIKEESYDNPWGYVPAIVISDIIDTMTDFKKSPLDPIIDLADEYLRETSIKTLYKYHHGFPMFWMYVTECTKCKGIGTVEYYDNNDLKDIRHEIKCPSCHGAGYAMKKDVSDIQYLTHPESSDDQIVTPDLAGYIVPPIESLTAMTDELKLLRDMMFFSHWGTVINREQAEQTAFEVAVNTQPVQDRLDEYSESLENTEQAITDMLGEYYYGQLYKGSSISLGRNYIIKGNDVAFQEYQEAKSNGAGINILNEKLNSYYTALYANNNFKYIIATKLMEIEPLVHNTIDEVKQMETTMYNKKLYYNDWLSTIDIDYIFITEVQKLKQELTDFTNQKIKENGISNENISQV